MKGIALHRKEINYDAEANEISKGLIYFRIKILAKEFCKFIEKPDKDILKRKARIILVKLLQLYIDSLEEDIKFIETKNENLEDKFYSEVKNLLSPLLELADSTTTSLIETEVNEIIHQYFYDPREQHMNTNKEKISAQQKKYRMECNRIRELETEKEIDSFIENYDESM